MRQEQQPWPRTGVGLTGIVERSHQRLAGARWGDHQVAVEAPVEPLRHQLIERCLLVGMGTQIEEHGWPRVSLARGTPGVVQRGFDPLAEGFIVRLEVLELLK